MNLRTLFSLRLIYERVVMIDDVGKLIPSFDISTVPHPSRAWEKFPFHKESIPRLASRRWRCRSTGAFPAAPEQTNRKPEKAERHEHGAKQFRVFHYSPFCRFSLTFAVGVTAAVRLARARSCCNGSSASDLTRQSAWSSNKPWVIGFGTATQKIPAARAAVIPLGESSNAIASLGAMPRSSSTAK